MKGLRFAFFALGAVVAASSLPSCIKDEEDVDKQWRDDNTDYVEQQEALVGEDGQKVYERIAPEWSPAQFVLVQWHTRPAGFATMMRPMSNSTVDIKYEGRLYDGTVFDSSYARTTHGDSIYRCRPNEMVVGMWTALTSMVPGDSVTLVIPAISGYGAATRSKIKPYSTLIFDVKMKQIVNFDTPSD